MIRVIPTIIYFVILSRFESSLVTVYLSYGMLFMYKHLYVQCVHMYVCI